MKQFQKIGVAAAVASVAAGALAADVSRTETGDLAIVPYYTVKDGMNTGLHIINTTDQTQVVKVRLRRGTDSKDALDFNLVMSPQDEWTANIGAGGDTGVRVTTNDTTCTVPPFAEGGTLAQMPPTFSKGATEGYVEIIAMAQAADDQPIAVAAKHAVKGATKGIPADCDAVRQNFYRVAADDVLDEEVRGVHHSSLTSTGECTAGLNAKTGSVCTGVNTEINLSSYTDSDDNALKVSFMLTDPTGGLEAGDNAVMIEGFASEAMMTNQMPLSFGTDGLLNFDPLNFELPNLAYGAYAPTDAGDRKTAIDAVSSITDGTMWDDLSEALDADSIANDWASFSTADATVAADWVVTLPGQYVMTNPICDIYTNYGEANATAAAECTNASAVAAYSALGTSDRNQLPLTVSTSYIADKLTGSNLNLWDREEFPISGTDEAPVEPETDLGFSPGGVSGTEPGTKTVIPLPNEVNVIAFNGGGEDDSAVMSDLKLTVDVPGDSDRGWGRLDIVSSNADPERWILTAADGGDIQPTAKTLDNGKWADHDAGNVAVVGFAVWQRSFAEQAGNYGRIVEHSTVNSSGAGR